MGGEWNRSAQMRGDWLFNVNNIYKVSRDSRLLFMLDFFNVNTMIASVSFVLTGNLIRNFPQTGEISNFPLINMHEQTSNSQKNSKQC